MKELYNTTKKLAGKYSKPEQPVKDKDGRSIITGDEQQKNRWREHFVDLLNQPGPQNPPDIIQTDTDLPIVSNALTREEIRKAIQLLRNRKAAGPDNTQAKALKVDTEITVKILYPLFKKIWEEEQVP